MRSQWIVLPAEGGDPFLEDVPAATLPALQAHVGGYVELVRLDLPGHDEVDLWVHDEGAYSDAPVNTVATIMARSFSDVALQPEGIRGGAVLATATPAGRTTGLRPATIDRLNILFAALNRKVTS